MIEWGVEQLLCVRRVLERVYRSLNFALLAQCPILYSPLVSVALLQDAKETGPAAAGAQRSKIKHASLRLPDLRAQHSTFPLEREREIYYSNTVQKTLWS